MQLELSREYEVKLEEISAFIREQHGVEYSVDGLISQLILDFDSQFDKSVRSGDYTPPFVPPFIPILGSDGQGGPTDGGSTGGCGKPGNPAPCTRVPDTQ
ncbi:hypothetical protein D8T49_21920 [Vibrio vulnificus]|uniref:hypothetical protein n=1 Tax=Vibrio TaxID=662 RepID=UPI001022F362|nr:MULTISPECIES: hypothetical protein [Vibrio]EGQ7700415.1 hypothetical protein [Vibrio vulnificus]EGQ8176387.1 hypothetical protein [Vibrio vulnificus]EGQ9240260.1 hypothetical protein [Vibrio vulnificus]EGQ9330137.1 hypothetical protein [Vibrio vulnificus]EGQ9784891.1 hypothetical protein [Vibrio vulnificus]